MVELKEKILAEVDAPKYNIKLKSDGIVYVVFKENTMLDIDLQIEMLNIYKEITKDELTPFMFEAEYGVEITKEARDNAIVMEDQTPCKVTAVIVQNIAYALIANFYMKFNKPKRPFKVYNKKEEAIEWLKSHL